METFTVNQFTQMRQNLIWRDNIWNSIDKGFISIKDRGLRFGDGIIETILIRNNKPILLDLDDETKCLFLATCRLWR